MKAKETKKGNVKITMSREEAKLLFKVSSMNVSVPRIASLGDKEKFEKIQDLLNNLHRSLLYYM